MIRFIDLGDQILEGERQFAWYDTVTDSFLEFSGNQVWSSWVEFCEDHFLHFPTMGQVVTANNEREDLVWFKRLFGWDSHFCKVHNIEMSRDLVKGENWVCKACLDEAVRDGRYRVMDGDCASRYKKVKEKK